ncbi:MAG: hypothetical protein HFH29_05375 [Eubacterium sp.]|nr:hypothetical protein [Eubacterium sp.]
MLESNLTNSNSAHIPVQEMHTDSVFRSGSSIHAGADMMGHLAHTKAASMTDDSDNTGGADQKRAQQAEDMYKNIRCPAQEEQVYMQGEQGYMQKEQEDRQEQHMQPDQKQQEQQKRQNQNEKAWENRQEQHMQQPDQDRQEQQDEQKNENVQENTREQQEQNEKAWENRQEQHMQQPDQDRQEQQDQQRMQDDQPAGAQGQETARADAGLHAQEQTSGREAAFWDMKIQPGKKTEQETQFSKTWPGTERTGTERTRTPLRQESHIKTIWQDRQSPLSGQAVPNKQQQKQPPVLNAGNAGTKQTSVLNAGNAGTKQPPVLNAGNAGTKQTSVPGAGSLSQKQPSLLNPGQTRKSPFPLNQGRPSNGLKGQKYEPAAPFRTGQAVKGQPDKQAVQIQAQQRLQQVERMQKLRQDAAAEKMIQKQHEFERWRIQETEKLESKKQKLRRQTRQMEEERMQLNIEKAHFYRQQEFELTKKKHEEHLLEMKRQILEGELYKLAEEKKQFEQKKNFYKQVDSYQKSDIRTKPASVHGEIFFAGVNSQSSLKKRYKDLLKIYHPDNKCGDTDAIQEINREYQRLLEKMQQKG